MSTTNTLNKLIAQERRERFTPEYQDQASDAEVLGIIVASHFEWDGLRILETAVSALEDANFHTESAAVRAMLDAEKTR